MNNWNDLTMCKEENSYDMAKFQVLQERITLSIWMWMRPCLPVTSRIWFFAVTIPAPKNEDEWRAIVKDPSRFVAKKVAKGVEVSWQKLNVQQRSAMTEAKSLGDQRVADFHVSVREQLAKYHRIG